MFSLESPHRGDSSEHIQYAIVIIKYRTTLDYSKSAAMGLKNEFETAMVNELSVFEQLKSYCNIRCCVSLCLLSILNRCHLENKHKTHDHVKLTNLIAVFYFCNFFKE